DILDNGSLTLQYSRNRYYEYHTGRWLTRDPLGHIDGMNLYTYVSSNPMMNYDPYGLYRVIDPPEQERPPGYGDVPLLEQEPIFIPITVGELDDIMEGSGCGGNPTYVTCGGFAFEIFVALIPGGLSLKQFNEDVGGMHCEEVGRESECIEKCKYNSIPNFEAEKVWMLYVYVKSAILWAPIYLNTDKFKDYLWTGEGMWDEDDTSGRYHGSYVTFHYMGFNCNEPWHDEKRWACVGGLRPLHWPDDIDPLDEFEDDDSCKPFELSDSPPYGPNETYGGYYDDPSQYFNGEHILLTYCCYKDPWH
ncbi:RHS repeat-associated core domain-containing protein, partial [Planctomycetota bacterium]